MGPIGDLVAGPSTSSTTSTNDFTALLQNLHQSKVSAELDQKTCEKNLQSTAALDKQFKHLTKTRDALHRKINDAESERSKLASQLAHTDIREKIVSEGIKGAEADVERARDALNQARSKITSISRKFLTESTDFAVNYSATPLGRENRIKASREEFEDLKAKKNQLGFELAKFLEMKRHVEECEQENKELQESFKLKEAADGGREQEAFQQLSALEGRLEGLEAQAAAMDKELVPVGEEARRLQAQLESVNQTISFWERRVADCRQQMGQQQQQHGSSSSFNAKVTTTAVGTSPGVPPPHLQFRANNAPSNNNSLPFRPQQQQQFPTQSKQPRLSVRPVPQQQQQKVVQVVRQQLLGGTQKPQQPIKYVQTTLPAMSGKTGVNKQTRFIPPATTTPKTAQRYDSNSGAAAAASASNNKNCDPFDDDDEAFSSSQYFTGGGGGGDVSAANAAANNSSTTTTTTGRAFNFKKKSIPGGPTTILPGPSSSSVAVTLGKTPFSTFNPSSSYYQSSSSGSGSNK